MSGKEHSYALTVEWTGNAGSGTSGYRTYQRAHTIVAEGKPVIPGSSDPSFRGDPARYNPEDLLVGSVSACHMLWYLHMCAASGIVVTGYVDRAEGTMVEDATGGGRFVGVTLRPEVTLASGSDEAAALKAHHEAHENCFVANSVNFPIAVEPVFRTA
jgi:organic hydroperoxide reductase OsmC/OhrA